jgi:site-specific DNA-methyltransferase (adenine-specific)
MAILERQHVPDILECLAQLSSDEVPTPPKLANAILDLLPDEVWTNPDYRWCDPCSKSGVFLREIVKRLLFEGLVEWEPDFEKRREHVFRKMIFGCGITELTGIISRRTVYYSRDAASEYSVIRMDSGEGNVPFVRAAHDFKRGRCTICSAPEDLERGRDRENHAYAFIHGAYPTKEMEDMKFDVIVGNPPYQLGASGGDSPGGFAMPLYQRFVERAIEMDPQYVLMITPSRWFAGGRSLDAFRDRMLHDRHMRRLVDFPNAAECFPGNEIKGGVSYFLWDRAHDGACEVTTIRGGKAVGETAVRDLGAYDVLVRYNQGVAILEKVWPEGIDDAALSTRVSPIQPFSIRTNFRGKPEPDGLQDPIGLYGNGGVTYIERHDVPRNDDWIDEWKVLLGSAYGAGEAIPHQITNVPIVAPPGTACSETYLVINRFPNEKEACRFAAYLSTRFVRFLISLRKNTQHLYSERFAFVPNLPVDRDWTDADLYERYGLTDDEIAFIESQVREMPAPAAA